MTEETPMTDQELAENILRKYRSKYPRARDMTEYIEYVGDMNRADLEAENLLIPD